MTAVRDFVVPLMTIGPTPGGIGMLEFLGTGFLLGSHGGYALTARHVVDRPSAGDLVAAFVDTDGSWTGVETEVVELHSQEDIALLRLHPDGTLPESPLVFGPSEVQASAGYSVWGYPEDVMNEVVENGRVRRRPDLVYSEGHVRRRLTGLDLPSIRGTAFLELSAVAGGGFSGSPVTLRQPHGDPWEVVAVYVGERTSITTGASVGYAARIDAARQLVEDHCRE